MEKHTGLTARIVFGSSCAKNALPIIFNNNLLHFWPSSSSLTSYFLVPQDESNGTLSSSAGQGTHYWHRTKVWHTRICSLFQDLGRGAMLGLGNMNCCY